MATITAVLVEQGAGYQVWKWVGLSATDTAGSAVPVAKFRDKSVQLRGTFGGNCAIEGSIDNGTTWATLNDPQGNALSAISAAKIEVVLEHCTHIRPTAGAGVTSVDVWMIIGGGRA